MVTAKILFYNFKTMADRVPIVTRKNCNSLRKMQKIRTLRKAVRPGFLFRQHGRKKKDTVQIL